MRRSVMIVGLAMATMVESTMIMKKPIIIAQSVFQGFLGPCANPALHRPAGPPAEADVTRLRQAHGGTGPADVVAKLERRYVAMVTASGMAVGAAATIPGIGTISALSAAAAETVAFLEATAFFALALAVVHG